MLCFLSDALDRTAFPISTPTHTVKGNLRKLPPVSSPLSVQDNKLSYRLGVTHFYAHLCSAEKKKGLVERKKGEGAT